MKVYTVMRPFIIWFVECRAQLFDLAVSLLPGLDAKEIDLLFVAMEPGLKVNVSFRVCTCLTKILWIKEKSSMF